MLEDSLLLFVVFYWAVDVLEVESEGFEELPVLEVVYLHTFSDLVSSNNCCKFI